MPTVVAFTIESRTLLIVKCNPVKKYSVFEKAFLYVPNISKIRLLLLLKMAEQFLVAFQQHWENVIF